MFIKIKNLHKNYGPTQVIRGIDFELEKSKELVILGSSGSGKSTLLYILGALESVDQGEVWINNRNITKMNDAQLADFRNTEIGFVFQFHFLLPSMTCIKNILLPAQIGGIALKDVKTRVQEFAKILNVEHCLKKYPYQLSGGEQQRINIIRAISLSPSILLCDEPTGNLDSKNSQVVINLLRDVSQRIGATLIIVTHDEKISNTFTNKITIEDGQIIS